MSTAPLRDYSSDTGRQLLNKLAVKHEFPDYVLSATEDDVRTEGHAKTCAQLTPTPRLPTHTKAATWLSYASFMEQRNELPREEREKVAKYLTKRADRWDITHDLIALERHEERLIKESAETAEKFPIRNVKEADAANTWLDGQMRSDTPEIETADRIDLARKISEWIEPTGLVKSAACWTGCCDGKKVASKLRNYNATRKISGIEWLAKAAEACTPIEMQTQQDTAAIVLGEVSDIPHPELFLKVSTDAPVAYLSNNAVVEVSKLAGFHSAALDAAVAVGAEHLPLLFDRVGDNVKIAEGMAADLADMFCDDLTKSGISLEVKRPAKDFKMVSLD